MISIDSLIVPNFEVANFDYYYGPWDSIGDALDNVKNGRTSGAQRRSIGKTVGIYTFGNTVHSYRISDGTHIYDANGNEVSGDEMRPGQTYYTDNHQGTEAQKGTDYNSYTASYVIATGVTLYDGNGDQVAAENIERAQTYYTNATQTKVAVFGRDYYKEGVDGVVEYWFKSGKTDADLVEKQTPGGGGLPDGMKVVTFDPNGGNNEYQQPIFSTTGNAILPQCNFSKNECEFVGWANAAVGTVILNPNTNVPLTDVTTVYYAQWRDLAAKIMFNGNNTSFTLNGNDVEKSEWITDVSGGDTLNITVTADNEYEIDTDSMVITNVSPEPEWEGEGKNYSTSFTMPDKTQVEVTVNAKEIRQYYTLAFEYECEDAVITVNGTVIQNNQCSVLEGDPVTVDITLPDENTITDKTINVESYTWNYPYVQLLIDAMPAENVNVSMTIGMKPVELDGCVIVGYGVSQDELDSVREWPDDDFGGGLCSWLRTVGDNYSIDILDGSMTFEHVDDTEYHYKDKNMYAISDAQTNRGATILIPEDSIAIFDKKVEIDLVKLKIDILDPSEEPTIVPDSQSGFTLSYAASLYSDGSNIINGTSIPEGNYAAYSAYTNDGAKFQGVSFECTLKD